MKLLLLILIVSLFSLESVWEAFYDKGKKRLSKLIQAAFWVLVFVFAHYFDPGVKDLAAFVFLRYALFNIPHNLIMGKGIFYLGDVDDVDVTIKKLHPPLWAYIVSMAIGLWGGIVLIFVV